MKCVGCDGPIDPHNDWTLVEITGWIRRRKGGGLNHVYFREDTGRLMCAECALSRRYTGDQLTLLEDAP